MTTETVEMILNKLGTTIENIVPATVDYMRHGVVVYLCIGIGLFVLGLICFLILSLIGHCNFDYDTEDNIGIACILFGGAAFVVGLIMTGWSIVSLHMWNAYPTIRAYETILGWLK